MNFRFIVIHLLALMLLGTWIVMQRRSIAGMEQRTAALRTSLGEHLASTRHPTESSGGNPGFSELLHAANRSSEGIGERAFLRLSGRIFEMSEQEIADALDELATLELTGDRHSTLETMLIDRLIEEFPEHALERFKHHIEEGDRVMIRKLSRGFGTWAKEHPAAASAWFDREIASGTFDNRLLESAGSSRLSFEAVMTVALLESDPTAAERRVQALPAQAHRLLFLRITMSDPDPTRFADLVGTTYSHGFDEILSNFIQSSAPRGQKEQTLPLIERIADPDLREKLSESLAR